MNEATQRPMLTKSSLPRTTSTGFTRSAVPSVAARNACDSGSLAHISGTTSRPATPPITNIVSHPRDGITRIANSAVSTAPTW